MTLSAHEILDDLKLRANAANVAGMSRFGIVAKLNLGVTVADLRRYARRLGRNQKLAEELWAMEYRELRILATLIGDADEISSRTMERWVRDLESWDICDACCINLFDRTPFAEQKVQQWSKRQPEFERRAGFVIIAGMASHLKLARDELFLSFLPIIEREAHDERNFVRKAVNWALRGIGKRNCALNTAALACGERIYKQDSKAARWIACDAIRELKSEPVQLRLRKHD